MGKINELIKEYKRFVNLPWQHGLAGPQRVWFVVYDPQWERRLRFHLNEFAIVTQEAHHDWVSYDLTSAFPRWMASHDYRESYFEFPDDLEMALGNFREYVAEQVSEVLSTPGVNENTVVCLNGVGSLFGLLKVSQLVEDVNACIKGRLLVLFPGEYDSGRYRLLDAGDGWNYLAVPITIAGGSNK